MAIKDSNEDDLKNKQDSSEENFGLPDIEYKPLDQSEPTSHVKEEVTSSSESTTYKSSYDDSGESVDDEEPKSKAPFILGIVIVLVLAVSGYLIYNFVIRPRQLAEKAKQEQLAKDALLKKQQEEEARLAKEREDERLRLEALEKAKPVIGTIETLSARTKRYYVVVTSDIDDDLLMDYAKKLSSKGISTKIIPPFGAKNFFRLAIADHETFALAQTNADAVKGDYVGVWVIKY